ncbi:BglG family transcription antiterminator [Lacticaseibacillus jixianensis]|uniref:BglG family transcription antiterminator n=1 Tax=Lacticaseibacillus jixianensis TaxID=2486012 RepID=A0ABW4B9Y6_9LACO|nr:BglG family transcription antiterminator [Lacticaseibacillus jixianensis]
MNARTRKILILLTDNANRVALPAHVLMRRFSVTRRTISNDIAAIKDYLKDYKLLVVHQTGEGYVIKGSGTALSQLREALELSPTALNADSRRQQIMIGLLMTHQDTSISDLADKYHVSRSAIQRDFGLLKQDLAQDGLDLVSDYRGTHVVGAESQIRDKLRQSVNDYRPLLGEETTVVKPANSRLDTMIYLRLVGLFGEVNTAKAEKILTTFENESKIDLNDVLYSNLVTHILIMVSRQEGSQIAPSQHEEQKANSPRLATEMSRLNQLLGDEFPNTFGPDDLQYLEQHLVMSGIQDTVNPELLNRYLNQFDNGATKLAKQLIEKVSSLLGIDLSNDHELAINLRTHCFAMLSRLKKGQTINNPLLAQIKENYASLFGVLVLALSQILPQDANPTVIPESEIGFLTVHFQASLEKNIETKRIVIVCPEGVGFSRLIQNKIASTLPLVKVVAVVPYKNVANYDFTGIDFVVSTLNFECAVPVVQVSGFLDSDDINKLNSFVVHHSMAMMPNKIQPYINERCVYSRMSFRNPEDVIKFMAEQMYRQQLVDKSFLDSAIRREHIMATNIGHGVAIPHAGSEHVIVPTIGVMTLDQPIEWGEGEADVVFTLALKFENAKQNKEAVNSLYYLVSSENMLQRLRAATTTEEMLACLRTGVII